MSRTPPTSQQLADFDPCPEGAHNAVVIDVSEPFEVDQTWQGKTSKVWKRVIAWQVSKRMPPGPDNQKGLRFMVMERFTDTLSTKSKPSLRQTIINIMGRALTNDEEFYGFEMEELIGKPCMVQVTHNTVVKDGVERIYANVTSVMALPEDMRPIAPEGWDRWKDRASDKLPKFLANARPRQTQQPPSADDDFGPPEYHGPGPDDVPLPF